jgi:hypothetical protein
MREQLPESHDSVMTIHAASGTRRSKQISVKNGATCAARRPTDSLAAVRLRIKKLHLFDPRITAQYDSRATDAGSDGGLNLAPKSLGEVRSIKFVEMMDRSVAMSDAEVVGAGDCGADPGLGVAHRGFHVFAFGKEGCDGGG